jgi:hypothetical protein
METDGRGKTKNNFSTRPCKTLLRFAQFPQARQRSINKQQTGQITCYKNRTFLLATDTLT